EPWDNQQPDPARLALEGSPQAADEQPKRRQVEDRTTREIVAKVVVSADPKHAKGYRDVLGQGSRRQSFQNTRVRRAADGDLVGTTKGKLRVAHEVKAQWKADQSGDYRHASDDPDYSVTRDLPLRASSEPQPGDNREKRERKQTSRAVG